MPAQKLAAPQVTELANYFTAISRAIGEFCEAKNLTHEISPEDNERLSEIQWELSNDADEFYTESAGLVMEDVASALATIKDVTTQIQSTYKALKDIQRAIYIAATAITLCTAILSQNPKTIVSAIQGLSDCWK
jgi:hypothetical protein